MTILKLSLAGCLLSLMACQPIDAPVGIKPPADSLPPAPPPPLPPMPTTRVEVLPQRNLPEGFYLDSLQYIDSPFDHHVLVYFPVALSHKDFNKRMQQFMLKYVQEYSPEKTNEADQSSEFDLWITGFDAAKKRVKFMMQSYYSGAAHFNQDSAVFVY